jgi:hypothetical protein
MLGIEQGSEVAMEATTALYAKLQVLVGGIINDYRKAKEDGVVAFAEVMDLLQHAGIAIYQVVSDGIPQADAIRSAATQLWDNLLGPWLTEKLNATTFKFPFRFTGWLLKKIGVGPLRNQFFIPVVMATIAWLLPDAVAMAQRDAETVTPLGVMSSSPRVMSRSEFKERRKALRQERG